MSSINPLGMDFNVSWSAATANVRFSLKNASGITFVTAGATTGNTTIQEHTAASGGTSQNLAAITEYWTQNNGVWTRVAQAALATMTSATGGIAAVFIPQGALSDGFSYISASHGTVGTFAIIGKLNVQRRLTSLPDVRA